MEHGLWCFAVLTVWTLLAGCIMVLGRMLGNEVIGSIGVTMAMLLCCVESF